MSEQNTISDFWAGDFWAGDFWAGDFWAGVLCVVFIGAVIAAICSFTSAVNEGARIANICTQHGGVVCYGYSCPAVVGYIDCVIVNKDGSYVNQMYNTSAS